MDGAARQHQPELVLNGAGARIGWIYCIQQTPEILGMDHRVKFRSSELNWDTGRSII